MNAFQIVYAVDEKSDAIKKALVITRGDMMVAITDFSAKYPKVHISKAEEVKAEVIIENEYASNIPEIVR